MRFHLVQLVVLALAILLPSRALMAASVDDFLVYSLLDNNNDALLPGRLHVPAAYATDPNIPRSLILFLHGGGESGTNNVSQINGNIDNLLAAAKARGAFLYAPQTNVGWANTQRLSDAMTMVDRAIAERSVAPNRIYVTGISMGGGGTWNFLNQFPNRVAAAVPIAAGGPSSSFLPANIVNEPIWAFHGRFDEIVPVTVTRDVINSLLAEAGQPIPTYPPLNSASPNVRFDFPPLDLHYTDMRATHVSWGRVYNDQAMYNWLFAQSQIPEPNTIVLAIVAICAFTVSRPRGHTTRVGRDDAQ